MFPACPLPRQSQKPRRNNRSAGELNPLPVNLIKLRTKLMLPAFYIHFVCIVLAKELLLG